jgi:dCTP diphosphatase
MTTTPEDHLDIAALREELREFARARDWEQFHSPKNLAMALAGEVGELLEVFQWLTEAQSADPSAVDREHAAEELADILIYLVRLTDVLNIDLPTAVVRKLSRNAARYPVEVSRGDATKASQREKRL